MGHAPDSCRGLQDLLQFCLVIVNSLKKLLGDDKPKYENCFAAFQNALQSDGGNGAEKKWCGLLVVVTCLCFQMGWKPPGLGAVYVVFKHKMVLLQFGDNEET